MKYLLILLLIFVANGPESIDNWKSHPVPTKEQARVFNTIGASDWQVFVKDNKIFATSDRNFKWERLPFKMPRNCFSGIGVPQTVLPVNNGYLLGFDNGEWGGALGWIDKKGKKCHTVANDQIVMITKVDNQIFAIEGVYHMSVSRGSLLRINNNKGTWETEKFLDLSSAPQGLGVDSNNNLIVITTKNLLKIRKDKSVEVLIENGFWDYLYPNSLIIKDDVAFIGMRKGILKYNLKTKNQEWLMND